MEYVYIALIVSLLQELDMQEYTVVASTTERIVTEVDGIKSSTFQFCRFRKYSLTRAFEKGYWSREKNG